MLNELAKEIHANAVAHGWWDEPRSFGEIVALCHSELSEALEEYRAGRPTIYCNHPKCPGFHDGNTCAGVCGFMSGTEKPEGMAVELVDCIIRILDCLGQMEVDVDTILREKHEYNKGRPYRHGGKAL